MLKTRARFDKSEIEQRQANVRAELMRRNLDCLIISDPANMYWLTGYDAWSFYVHQCIVISQDDLFWFGRGIDAFGVELTTWLEKNNITTYPDDCVQSMEKHPMQILAKMLQERKTEHSTVGIEKDNYYFSARAAETLYGCLSNSRFVDATGLVNWQRAVKSEQEIEYMQKAGKVIEKVYADIIEFAEPGIKKSELVSKIYASSILGTDDNYGDYPSIVPLIGTGIESAACHMTWDGGKIENNSITFLELAGAYARYHCPCSRTLCFGEVKKEYLEIEKVISEAIDAVFEQFKPGNTCADLANTFSKIITQYGYEKNNRCGYSIGASYPPDWGERTMSLREDDDTVLEKNMSFHFMPAIWFEDWGFEMTESVLVGDNGAIALSNVPRKLLIK